MRPIVPLVIVGVAAFFLLRRDAQRARLAAMCHHTRASEQRERTTRSEGSQPGHASQPTLVAQRAGDSQRTIRQSASGVAWSCVCALRLILPIIWDRHARALPRYAGRYQRVAVRASVP